MHSNRRIPQHGFRAGCGDGDRTAGIIRQGIMHIVKSTLNILVLHLIIRDGRLQHRVPVDQIRSAIE